MKNRNFKQANFLDKSLSVKDIENRFLGKHRMYLMLNFDFLV